LINNYGIFATLRGTPRSSAQETRMITIDAPLYPLLLAEKSSESAEPSKDSEPVKIEKPDGASKTEEIFEPKSKANAEAKPDEVYSWSSYVRNNFVVSNKAKKKGDLWKKLETYRKKLKVPLLPCTDEQAAVALEIFPSIFFSSKILCDFNLFFF
jgi:hypothetical protein